jgi:3-hydroxyisobutyrate dehydrogenase-like beta-hydroxyacid dehydrogenase
MASNRLLLAGALAAAAAGFTLGYRFGVSSTLSSSSSSSPSKSSSSSSSSSPSSSSTAPRRDAIDRDRIRIVQELLKDFRVDTQVLQAVRSAMRDALEAGLAAEGTPVKMLPTFVTRLPTGEESGTVRLVR